MMLMFNISSWAGCLWDRTALFFFPGERVDCAVTEVHSWSHDDETKLGVRVEEGNITSNI